MLELSNHYFEQIKLSKDTVPLERFCDQIICGTTPSTKDASLWGNDFPFVTVEAMANNVFVTKTERLISSDGYRKANRGVGPGYILVSCIGTIGVVSFASKDCITNQQINAIKPKEGFSYYLFWILRNKTKEMMMLSKSGSATPNINKRTFGKIMIRDRKSTRLNSSH